MGKRDLIKLDKLVKDVFNKAKKECCTHSTKALSEQIEIVIITKLEGKITITSLIRYHNRHVLKNSQEGSSPTPEKERLLKEYLKVRWDKTDYGELEDIFFGNDTNIKNSSKKTKEITIISNGKDAKIYGNLKIDGNFIINNK